MIDNETIQRRRERLRLDRQIDEIYNQAISEFRGEPQRIPKQYTPKQPTSQKNTYCKQNVSKIERHPSKLNLGTIVGSGLALAAFSGCAYLLYTSLREYFSR